MQELQEEEERSEDTNAQERDGEMDALEDSDLELLTAKYYEESSDDDDETLVVFSENRSRLRTKENNKRKLQDVRQSLELKTSQYVGVCVQDPGDEESSWEIVQVKTVDTTHNVFEGILHERQPNGKQFWAKLDTSSCKMTANFDVATALAVVKLNRNGVLDKYAQTVKSLNTLAAERQPVSTANDDTEPPASRPKPTYEVESIWSMRRTAKNALEFEVKWRGFVDTTWETGKSLRGSEQLRQDFMRANTPPPFKQITVREWVSFPTNAILPQQLLGFDPLLGQQRETTREWLLDMDAFCRLNSSGWLTQELLYFGLHNQVVDDSEVCVFSTEIWSPQRRQHPGCWARCSSDPSPQSRRIWLMPMSWDASGTGLLHANSSQRNTHGTHWTCLVLFFPPIETTNSPNMQPIFAMHLDSMQNVERGNAASIALNEFLPLLAQLCSDLPVYKMQCLVPAQANTWQCGDHVIVACRSLCKPGVVEVCYNELVKKMSGNDVVADLTRFVPKPNLRSLRPELMKSITNLRTGNITKLREHHGVSGHRAQIAQCIDIRAINGDIWINFEVPQSSTTFWATTRAIEQLWKRVDTM
jgi:hypothetical protein